MKHKLTDEECIHDLEVIRQDFLKTCGAEPMCLGYAIERLKEFSKYIAVKVVGETRNEEPERPQGECCGSCYLCDVGNCGADLRGKEK